MSRRLPAKIFDQPPRRPALACPQTSAAPADNSVWLEHLRRVEHFGSQVIESPTNTGRATLLTTTRLGDLPPSALSRCRNDKDFGLQCRPRPAQPWRARSTAQFADRNDHRPGAVSSFELPVGTGRPVVRRANSKEHPAGWSPMGGRAFRMVRSLAQSGAACRDKACRARL
jgi:hypothetical protein